MDEMRVAYISKHDNLIDLMTKCRPNGYRRESLLSCLMWDIYDKVKTISEASISDKVIGR